MPENKEDTENKIAVLDKPLNADSGIDIAGTLPDNIDNNIIDFKAFDKLKSGKGELVDTAPPKVNVDKKTNEDIRDTKTDKSKEAGSKTEEVVLDKEKKDATEQLDKTDDKGTQQVSPEQQKEIDAFIPPDIAKKMSKESREWALARLNEQKQTKAEIAQLNERLKTAPKDLPSSYLEHEQAYTLSPKYQESVGLFNQANKELAHWKEQRKLIRAGEDWTDLNVDANGKIVASKVKADADAEDAVGDYIKNAEDVAKTAREQINTLAQGFKASREAQVGREVALENKYFPGFVTEDAVKKDPFINPMVEFLKKEGIERVPVTTFAKMYSLLMSANAHIQTLTGKADKTVELAKQELAAGPGSKEINNGNGGKKSLSLDEQPIDMSAYNRLKT